MYCFLILCIYFYLLAFKFYFRCILIFSFNWPFYIPDVLCIFFAILNVLLLLLSSLSTAQASLFDLLKVKLLERLAFLIRNKFWQ